MAQGNESGSGSGLRRNAIGLPGAVIMSAAIMGPAVSTFFNPQYSTPFSGYATPFVYLLCLIAMLITASGRHGDGARAAQRRRVLHVRDPRPRRPRRLRHRRALMFVAYALLPPAEIGLIGSYLQSTFNDRVRT